MIMLKIWKRLLFTQISQIQINDGVSYDKDSIEVEKITEGADFDGVRIKITVF
ncbi:hypothetical protein ACTWKD_11115 [Halanaerobium saccharolyticum]|uniref:hypothetical protein n=1 Tax=Halanaerobium saccharolyticum TaxID=43595 RepID=UPI003FCE0063